MTGESILVVEDNGIIALQIGELLEKNGYRVSGTTAYGEEAVELAKKNLPDLICMDIELMGKIDGIETARRIHEHADIPLIFLTAYSDSRRLARATETAPYNYIVKPFDERELLVAVEMALHRHAVDQQLRETMQRYRAIVDNAAEGILLVSCDTKAILEANPASIRLLGYTGEELTGMNVVDIIAGNSGEDGTRSWHDFTPDRWSGEVQLQCRDGSLRDVDLTSRIIPREGVPALSCVVVHDITERKRAEKAVCQANKKLNLLSGITRHDINNQLSVLQTYLLFLEKEQAGPVRDEYFRKVAASVQRISAIIRFTKEYEEIGVRIPAWQDCHALVGAASEQASPGKIVVVNDLLPGTEVFADPLAGKVFYNLIDNALRYGGSGMTKIKFFSSETGAGVILTCEDDGAGISGEDKKRLFERGFGKNTGLGLFLSREILSITKISLNETSEPGNGARFEMVVPKEAYRFADVQ
ncbi:response regulator [Methanoregula sp.]|uniref:ATP-binding response regulator n=1 Tax=Methanoregula sp. TaxID=2052170 RepID=UPI003BB12418